jgi:hypothetical protein
MFSRRDFDAMALAAVPLAPGHDLALGHHLAPGCDKDPLA